MNFITGKKLFQEYSGDPTSQAAYQVEIDRVHQQLRDLWLYNDNGTPDTKDDSYITSFAVPFITTNDIQAQSGTIYIYGDNFARDRPAAGAGGMSRSPSRTTARPFCAWGISPSRITRAGLSGLTVVNVSTNNDIKAINKNGSTPGFSLTTSADSAVPQVNVSSNFSADDPQPPGYTGVQDAGSLCDREYFRCADGLDAGQPGEA